MSKNWYNQADLPWIKATREVDVSQHYDNFLSGLKPGASILDLGCGAGRDAKYFHEHGYHVVAIDESEYMCRLTKEYTDRQVPVVCTSVQNFKPEYLFDSVWAMASLVHADDQELDQMLASIKQLLTPDGQFYTMFKEATEAWTDPKGRFYNWMTAERLNNLLLKHDYNIKEIMKVEDKMGRSESWICVKAEPNSPAFEPTPY